MPPRSKASRGAQPNYRADSSSRHVRTIAFNINGKAKACIVWPRKAFACAVRAMVSQTRLVATAASASTIESCRSAPLDAAHCTNGRRKNTRRIFA